MRFREAAGYPNANAYSFSYVYNNTAVVSVIYCVAFLLRIVDILACLLPGCMVEGDVMVAKVHGREDVSLIRPRG